MIQLSEYVWWNDEDELTFDVHELLGDTTFDPADLKKMVITKSCIHLFTVKNPKEMNDNGRQDIDEKKFTDIQAKCKVTFTSEILTFKLIDFEFIRKTDDKNTF